MYTASHEPQMNDHKHSTLALTLYTDIKISKYHIAGNFCGRIFLRISWIDSDSLKYSPRTFCAKPMLIYGVLNLDKMIASMRGKPAAIYNVTS